MSRLRNEKGTGSFYFHEGRERWISSIPTNKRNPKSGKLIRIEKSFKDKNAGKRYHKEMLSRKESGTFIGGPRITFKEFALKYLEFYASDCKKTTINYYRGVLKNHFYPSLGHRSIADITSGDLQELLAILHRDKNQKTVETYQGVLHSVFSEAENQDIIPFNPVRKTRIPKKKKDEKSKKQRPWNLEEVRAVLLSEWGVPMNAFIALALGTGMRRGEILALKWNDLDLETGSLYIDETLCATTTYSLDGSSKKTELVFNSPKTPESERHLQVQTEVLRSLRVILKTQELMKLEKGKQWNPMGLVFCTNEGGPIHPSTHLSRYKRFLKKHGHRYITIHDIRHTFATLLVEDDTPIEQVQTALGHLDSNLTKNVYASNVPVLGQKATAHAAKLFYPDCELNDPIDLPRTKKTQPQRSRQRTRG